MAKITAEQLEIADGWREFGQRLGWTLISCSIGNGLFQTRAGNRTNILTETREDIERTWRELEQSNVEQIRTSTGGPIRSGTDG